MYQKYRSHRKHLLAREAEAANWTRKRHIYGLDSTGANANGRNRNGWLAPAPTLGYPPPPPAAVASPPVHHHHLRPLHVWGHPTVDQSVMPHVWPKHLPPPSTAMATPPFWVSDTPYWPRVSSRLPFLNFKFPHTHFFIYKYLNCYHMFVISNSNRLIMFVPELT